MHLTKHHGLGNDFLVLLDELQPAPVAVDAELARAVCDRHRGIGADGLLHGRAPGADDGAVEIVMRLYNADGGVAEMSGNGIRCFAQAVAAARGLGPGPLRIGTDAGLREVVLGDTGGGTVEVEVDMGPARPGPTISDEVLNRLGTELAAAHVGSADLGNPHIVAVVPEPGAVDLAELGPWLEVRFPHGVNAELIAVDGGVDEPTMHLRVWERGVGITQACGTGACAATALAAQWGLIADQARVEMPGGAATVVLRPDGTLVLRGPSELIATIDWPSDG